MAIDPVVKYCSGSFSTQYDLHIDDVNEAIRYLESSILLMKPTFVQVGSSLIKKPKRSLFPHHYLSFSVRKQSNSGASGFSIQYPPFFSFLFPDRALAAIWP